MRRIVVRVPWLVLLALPAVGIAQPSDTSRISHAPLFTARDAMVGGGVVLAAIALARFDSRIAIASQDSARQADRFYSSASDRLSLANEKSAGALAAVAYLTGRVGRLPRLADAGLHTLEGVAAATIVCSTLKPAIGRARPYENVDRPYVFKPGRGFHDGGYRSFPSQHEGGSFAFAAAVTSEARRWRTGSVWVVAPLTYGTAALVGASRIYDNKHWASDVVIGGAIGTFSGLKAVQYAHSHPTNRLDRWLLRTQIAPTSSGAMMRVEL